LLPAASRPHGGTGGDYGGTTGDDYGGTTGVDFGGTSRAGSLCASGERQAGAR